MEKTEKFRMRRYSKKTATNIYAAPMRVVNKSCGPFLLFCFMPFETVLNTSIRLFKMMNSLLIALYTISNPRELHRLSEIK